MDPSQMQSRYLYMQILEQILVAKMKMINNKEILMIYKSNKKYKKNNKLPIIEKRYYDC